MIQWLEANAGTGKTTQLIQTIHHHLNQNGGLLVQPERIVCLTYTRLAACEIKQRLRCSGLMRRPRVETLHSFCWKLLDIPDATLLDQDAQSDLIAKSVEAVWHYCEQNPDGALYQALHTLRCHVRESIVIDSLIEWMLMHHNRAGQPPDCGELQEPFFKLAWALRATYSLKKEQMNFLDYHDILALVHRQGITDPFLNHLLVDEAQDLSSLEWSIIDQLTQPFFHPHQKDLCSLFVVGDLKQSIYSFQGACPQAFLHYKEHFRQKAQCANWVWHEKKLTCSYRSWPNLLKAVDSIVAPFDPAIFDQKHHTHHKSGGHIELWNLDPDTSQLCRRVVQTIRDLDISPHEIMILFHTRGKLWNAMNETLAQNGLIQQKVTHEPLCDKTAVQAALSWAHVMMDGTDKRYLIPLLASPLVGMRYEHIATLMQSPSELETYIHTAQPLAQLRHALAIDMPPTLFFTLFFKIWPASDIKLLIDQACLFESMNPPSLALFLSWVETRTSPIKHDSHPSDVRMMTVHAAKGLEARAVFLPDTLSPPTLRLAPRFFPIKNEGGQEMYFWSSGETAGNDRAKELKTQWLQRNKSEYQRLFYVALTRAKERLYIGGAGNKFAPDSWYAFAQSCSPAFFHNLL